MYAKQSPVPVTRSPLLKPHSENLIYDIHSTETSNYTVDADIWAAQQSRPLRCSFCSRVLQSRSGLTNHEKSHIRQILRQERLERYKKNKKPRIYTCKECGEILSQRGLLNEHVKKHLNIIKCIFCKSTFKDRLAFEIHDAISDGKNYESLNIPAHRTRAQSRLSCHSVRHLETPFPNGLRSRSLSAMTSLQTVSRPISRLSMSSEILPRRPKENMNGWIENNYISDDFSDTASEISFGASSTAWSEADFIQDRFICSESNCMKTFPTLNLATIHEMKEHMKLALFRCDECRKRFTTSDNLHQHRIRTHCDVLICVLCEYPQKGMAAIDEHFVLHQKYSVKCDVCSKTFLSKYYLDEHLKSRKHTNYRDTKGAILIRVDRRETRMFLNIDELSSNLPVKLKSFSVDRNCGFEEDRSRIDDLPWRT